MTFLFFAYTVLCLVHSLFTAFTQGDSMRYEFICNFLVLGGKSNCPHKCFKLIESWLHLSLSNNPTRKREVVVFFFKVDPDFILQSLHMLLWHYDLRAFQFYFSLVWRKKRHMEAIKGYSSVKQRIEEINTTFPL